MTETRLWLVEKMESTRAAKEVLADTRFDTFPTDFRTAAGKAGITRYTKVMRQLPVVVLGSGMSFVPRGAETDLSVDVPGVTLDDEFTRYLLFGNNETVQKHSLKYLTLATMLQAVLKFDTRFKLDLSSGGVYEREVATWRTAGALALGVIPYETVKRGAKEALEDGGRALERVYMHNNEYAIAEIEAMGINPPARALPPAWIGLCFPSIEIESM